VIRVSGGERALAGRGEDQTSQKRDRHRGNKSWCRTQFISRKPNNRGSLIPVKKGGGGKKKIEFTIPPIFGTKGNSGAGTPFVHRGGGGAKVELAFWVEKCKM